MMRTWPSLAALTILAAGCMKAPEQPRGHPAFNNPSNETALMRQTEPTIDPALEIETLTPGTGEGARFGDHVSVHYTGTFADGSKFDSSLDRGKPFQFRLGEGMVIQGWEQGIFGMTVGEKRKLVVPPHLGYGAEGSPPKIPPQSTLVFEVEMLSIRQ